jgi:hypothetical protein
VQAHIGAINALSVQRFIYITSWFGRRQALCSSKPIAISCEAVTALLPVYRLLTPGLLVHQMVDELHC